MVIVLIAYFDFLVILFMLYFKIILTLILKRDFSHSFEDILCQFWETIWQIFDEVKVDLLS